MHGSATAKLQAAALRLRPVALATLIAFAPPAAQPQVLPGDQAPSASIQSDYSRDTGLPIRWTHPRGIEFVLIPPGEFVMGTPSDPLAPPHIVRVTHPFYLSVTEITQAQYEAVTGRQPSFFRQDPDSPLRPVEQVSFAEAREFCTLLEHDDPHHYRLPTEAEWEYACRAGSADRFQHGNDGERLADWAWFSTNSGQRTRPVATLQANAFGIYDMHGNVWEWVDDCFAAYGEGGPAWDPRGECVDGGGQLWTLRVMRGGAWNVPAHRCACAVRGYNYETMCAAPFIGFRVARDVPAESGDRQR